ncbi:glucose 1-dehydrogenase [Bradyrhizobium canariense]|uniref:SDR family NAD(P)-dependent oxidoreductase n=1 Tax=Bradyrhizobium canariense TaxID=255045 RepID=UPI001CA51499|nr:glucose 1-dehydrogenase [Bradyrhizobium canariense]MBW5435760.1 glucose 1-dehydrogenase [Bradyrhizobium canariense]
MRLRDKVAIITGSTQGIGEAIALRFAREGAKVAIVASRDVKRAEAVVKKLSDENGTGAAFVADCSRVSEIKALVAAVVKKFGQIDILVNNAGIMHTAPIEDTTEEMWDAQIDLNLKGTFFMTQAVLPEFRRLGRGKVINISSIWGIGAGPNCPAYCAAKGGIVNLTRALAVEIGRENINVNSLAPGNIATPLNAHLRGPDMEAYIAQMRALTPTGRDFLQPDEITGTAVYLASSDSDAVHGITVPVDAGWGAW